MATVYSLVCENGRSGSYWSNLSASERLRYGPVGSERVYGGLKAWRDGRASSGVQALDVEVCEVGNAFTETITSTLNFDLPCLEMRVTTLIQGARSAAFHAGSFTAGYILKQTNSTTVLNITTRATIDGIHLYQAGNAYRCLYAQALYTVIKNNIIQGRLAYESDATSAAGINVIRPVVTIHDNIIYDFGAGVNIYHYSNCRGILVYNNIVFKCGVGFYVVDGRSDVYGSYHNNIAIDNTTNWGYESAGIESAYNNFGETGDTPWGVSPRTISTTDFYDYVGGDLRAALSTSPQVGGGIIVYGGEEFDMVGTIRPNYNPTGEELWDGGCFEFDHGNGLAPKTVSIGISGIVAGSDLAIYKSSDNTEIVAPTTISGTNFSTTYTYTGDTTVTVKIRNASGTTKYKPYTAQGVIGENGLSMIVAQIEDPIAS